MLHASRYKFHGVLNSREVSQEKKQALQENKDSLSYLKIVDQIIRLQKKLDQAYRNKYNLTIEDEASVKIQKTDCFY